VPSREPGTPPADPPSDDFIMRNAMDAQEVAVGWWPGDTRYGKAAFYAYAHPAPAGFAEAALSPAAARWDAALGEYVLDWAASRGYRGIQFNAVVETNTSAVQLWEALGFDILTTVPDAFDHPDHGYVGLHVMYRRLAVDDVPRR